MPGLLFLHTACGYGGRSDAQAARIGRRGGVVGHGIVVGFDSGPVQRLCQFLAGDVFISQVDENKVVVGAAGDEVEAVFEQFLGHCLWRF